ncbi:MAG: hypothetical protein EBU08_22775 [Micrococcales bacterium]|nr:hypothetical protein [Micrococcales bacterium]
MVLVLLTLKMPRQRPINGLPFGRTIVSLVLDGLLSSLTSLGSALRRLAGAFLRITAPVAERLVLVKPHPAHVPLADGTGAFTKAIPCRQLK